MERGRWVETGRGGAGRGLGGSMVPLSVITSIIALSLSQGKGSLGGRRAAVPLSLAATSLTAATQKEEL